MSYPFALEPLPYAENALEPHISKETLSFHYGKHHAGYVKKLNGLLESSDLIKNPLTLHDLITKHTSQKALFNNAAQIWNHTFYWKSMAPSKSALTGPLEQAIVKAFGSVADFKTKFSTVAAGHFGSGWVWLVKNASTGALEIIDTHDAFNPLVESKYVPLLVLDVWEHAYYIDKRNDRAAYINEFLEIINWEFANQNFVNAKI